MARKITNYQLYRWRYVIGYTLGILVVVGLMLFSIFLTPFGLDASERSSALLSGQLKFDTFDPASVVNLPYHLLQRGSIELFGATTLAIKLPSMLLGLISIAGIFMLIKSWFYTNTAMITTLICATTPLFLFMIQYGTPLIYAIAVSTWLLAAGTMVSRRKSPVLFWKLLFFTLLALNLYAPLGIYLNLVLLSVLLFHPHIRHLARAVSLERIIAGSVLALLVLTPLIYSIAIKPSIGLELLGVPSSLDDLGGNAKQVFMQWTGLNGNMSQYLAPLLSIGTTLVMLIGIWYFILVKYTARSYVTWLWTLVLVPLIFMNPQYAALIFPLATIILAIGINSLIAEWYKLFPYNPYARVAGLLPIVLIVSGLMFSGALRYTNSYYYGQQVATHFSSDRQLLDRAVATSGATKDNPMAFLAPKEKSSFYRLVDQHEPRIEVVETISETQAAIVHTSHRQATQGRLPSKIIVSERKNNADRFYVYKSVEKE